MTNKERIHVNVGTWDNDRDYIKCSRVKLRYQLP